MVYLDKINVCLRYLYIAFFFFLKSSIFVFLLFAFGISRNNRNTLHCKEKLWAVICCFFLTEIFKLLKKANFFFFPTSHPT